MKNYLFAPFEDDAEKIEEFNHFKNYLSSGHRNSLIMFIGRLESYYDAFITDLQADNKRLTDGFGLTNRGDFDKIVKLQAENNELKAENCDLINNANFDKDKMIKELQAENDALKDKLQGVNDDYNNDHKVHNEYEDGLLNEVKELKAENEDLIKACNMIRADKTSHYPKEYKAEAEEYFDHNPQAEKLFFFMITDYDMKDAESGDLMLNQDDAICVINNEGGN